METETTTRSEFPNEGKAIVEQILESQERNKVQKSRTENYSLGSE